MFSFSPGLVTKFMAKPHWTCVTSYQINSNFIVQKILTHSAFDANSPEVGRSSDTQ